MIRSKDKTGVTNHGNYLASTTKYFEVVRSWSRIARSLEGERFYIGCWWSLPRKNDPSGAGFDLLLTNKQVNYQSLPSG